MQKNDYKDKNVVISLSGGQDSTTCLYWAKKRFKEVYAIGFDYGQKHKRELIQARKIAKNAKVDYKIINLQGIFSNSSLLEDSRNHNKKSNINSDLPSSFVAGRNIIFASVAASYAASKNINDIVLGVSQTDYSGYPDCRKTTLSALELSLSLGLGIGDFRIHTPLMYITKAEEWKLAKELNCLDVIINDTLTDYNGDTTMNEWGMGKANNPASILRKKSFYQAKEKGWI